MGRSDLSLEALKGSDFIPYNQHPQLIQEQELQSLGARKMPWISKQKKITSGPSPNTNCSKNNSRLKYVPTGLAKVSLSPPNQSCDTVLLQYSYKTDKAYFRWICTVIGFMKIRSSPHTLRSPKAQKKVGG